MVGVAAEVYVCRRITEDTGGTYGVALNEGHLEQLLMAHSPPPPATAAQAKAELVRPRGGRGSGCGALQQLSGRAGEGRAVLACLIQGYISSWLPASR